MFQKATSSIIIEQLQVKVCLPLKCPIPSINPLLSLLAPKHLPSAPYQSSLTTALPFIITHGPFPNFSNDCPSLLHIAPFQSSSNHLKYDPWAFTCFSKSSVIYNLLPCRCNHQVNMCLFLPWSLFFSSCILIKHTLKSSKS